MSLYVRRRMTAGVASKIKTLWAHTGLNQAQIAAVLGCINQGRVAEVVTGQRFAHVPPAPAGDWMAPLVELAVALSGGIGPRR